MPGRRGKYDELLAAPEREEVAGAAAAVQRAAATYASRDERFELKQRDYDRQFAQLYFYRLLAMQPHVEVAARSRWPSTRGATLAGGGAGQ